VAASVCVLAEKGVKLKICGLLLGGKQQQQQQLQWGSCLKDIIGRAKAQTQSKFLKNF